MTDLSLEKMLSRWEKSTREISGNLTANDYLPPEIRRRLLVENYNLIGDMDFEELSFTPLCQELSDIEGMDILSGLQKLKKEGNLTVFRAIRFPTISRIRDTVHDLGLSMPNYEQERIIQLYGSSKYAEKRETMQEDPNFWTQPQERVVDGMPVFSLVNDALQIHRAYRSERDRVLMIGIHVPHKLIESGDLKLIANTAIDLDYDNDERDFRITDFQEKEGCPAIDYKALRIRGIDLHEMHIKGLPFDLEGHKRLGIEQRFFLLDIYQADPKDQQFESLDTDVLKEHEYFLHGIFGDQNVFGRGPTRYLPSRCYEVKQK